MAEEVQNPPWDDQIDVFISNIDKEVSKLYDLSLREFLLDPEKFANVKDILTKVDKIRASVDDYFNGIKDSLPDEQASFAKALETADAQYNRMDEAISTKAALSRVPYIKPYDVDYNPDVPEEITIEQYNNAADALITKLVNISNYVGDISYAYDKYTIGSWIFSGQKVHIVSIYLPPSIISEITQFNTRLDGLIDYAYQQVKLILGK